MGFLSPVNKERGKLWIELRWRDCWNLYGFTPLLYSVPGRLPCIFLAFFACCLASFGTFFGGDGMGGGGGGVDNSLYKKHGHIFWEFCVKTQACAYMYKSFQKHNIWISRNHSGFLLSKNNCLKSTDTPIYLFFWEERCGLPNQSRPNPSDSIKREETICNSHKPLFDK